MAAQVRHVGRKSGRQYVSRSGARLSGRTFVIPLTFGNQSDWSRNVRAAGGCTIRLNGVDYRASKPELVTYSPDELGTSRTLLSGRGLELDYQFSRYPAAVFDVDALRLSPLADLGGVQPIR
jgi:hypothetical protein